MTVNPHELISEIMRHGHDPMAVMQEMGIIGSCATCAHNILETLLVDNDVLTFSECSRTRRTIESPDKAEDSAWRTDDFCSRYRKRTLNAAQMFDAENCAGCKHLQIEDIQHAETELWDEALVAKYRCGFHQQEYSVDAKGRKPCWDHGFGCFAEEKLEV